MNDRIAKFSIVAFSVILFLGLFFNYVSPFGKKVVRYEMGDESPFVQSLLPDERVSDVKQDENGDRYVELLDEPVYFSVFAPPGNFERVTTKVYFATEDEAIFELGALKDLFTQAFDLRPFANALLTNLTEEGWVSRPLEGMDVGTIFARTEALLENWTDLPATKIATFRKSLPWFTPEQHASEYTLSPRLVGSHEFFIIVPRNKVVTGGIRFIDGDHVEGKDDIALRVYSASGDLFMEKVDLDDGHASRAVQDSHYPSVDFSETFPAGLYKIIVSTTSDISFEMYASDPFVIKNSMNIDGRGHNLELFTNARTITVEPKNAEALGEVTFGDQKVALTMVGEKVKITTVRDDISRLVISDAGTMKISGEGFFSPTRNHFFAPEASGFSNFIVDSDAFDVVVAQVPEVKREDGWQVEETSFELSSLATERGAYKFVLSAPQIGEENGGVKVHAIELTFEKEISLRSFLSLCKRFLRDLLF